MYKIAWYLKQRKKVFFNIDNDYFISFTWHWVQRLICCFFFYRPASYKKINTRTLQVPGTDEVELICQAEGYPLAEVSWPNINVSANTSHMETSEGLYQVTSVLRLKPLPGRNFSCEFWNANVKELTSAIIDLQGKSSPSFLAVSQGSGETQVAHSEWVIWGERNEVTIYEAVIRI